MVQVFSVGVDDKIQREMTAIERRDYKPEKHAVNLHNLLDQLRNARPIASTDLEEEDVLQNLAALRVLIAILDVEGALLLHRQNTLNQMGACEIALMMAASMHDELCKKGLELGIALLKDGNEQVQLTMFKLMDPKFERLILPFDASSGRFLSKMMYRLRLAQREIGERRYYDEMQKERRDNFAEECEGLSPATIVLLRAELERPFPSRAFALDVLEFLRMLCEGHNNQWQNFLRVQPAAESIDLVIHAM